MEQSKAYLCLTVICSITSMALMRNGFTSKMSRAERDTSWLPFPISQRALRSIWATGSRTTIACFTLMDTCLKRTLCRCLSRSISLWTRAPQTTIWRMIWLAKNSNYSCLCKTAWTKLCPCWGLPCMKETRQSYWKGAKSTSSKDGLDLSAEKMNEQYSSS